MFPRPPRFDIREPFNSCNVEHFYTRLPNEARRLTLDHPEGPLPIEPTHVLPR